MGGLPYIYMYIFVYLFMYLFIYVQMMHIESERERERERQRERERGLGQIFVSVRICTLSACYSISTLHNVDRPDKKELVPLCTCLHNNVHLLDLPAI